MNLHPKILEVLYRRGFDESFLFPKLENIASYKLLEGIDEAVELIALHIRRGSKFMIYGDYDADGISALSLLYRSLKLVSPDLSILPYIPNRFSEGYGISKKAINKALEEGVDLFITVDCGITALEEVELLRSKGIDVIITDHHEPTHELPKANAIVHPHMGKYPFKHLTGVGVAYRLMEALYERLGINTRYLLWNLDLVAIGTVGDMGPLVEDNRILVHYGLKVLNRSKKSGIKAMLSKLGINRATTKDVAYRIVPRINSAGRISDPMIAFNLLTSKRKEDTLRLSSIMDRFNRERRKIEERVLRRALAQLTSKQGSSIPVLYDWGWHEGVLGIVASRIHKLLEKPVFIVSIEGRIAKGSARGSGEVHLKRLLEENSELFLRFGGHEQAAGFTMETEKIPLLEERLKNVSYKQVSKTKPEAEMLLEYKDITPSFLYTLSLMRPFGYGNPSPLFMMENLRIESLYRSDNILNIVFSYGMFRFKTRIYDPDEAWLNLKEGERVSILFRFTENIFKEGYFEVDVVDYER